MQAILEPPCGHHASIDSLVLRLHDGGEAHCLHPGGHGLLGVRREVVRPHVVVLSLETVLPERQGYKYELKSNNWMNEINICAKHEAT